MFFRRRQSYHSPKPLMYLLILCPQPIYRVISDGLILSYFQSIGRAGGRPRGCVGRAKKNKTPPKNIAGGARDFFCGRAAGGWPHFIFPFSFDRCAHWAHRSHGSTTCSWLKNVSPKAKKRARVADRPRGRWIRSGKSMSQRRYMI